MVIISAALSIEAAGRLIPGVCWRTICQHCHEAEVETGSGPDHMMEPAHQLAPRMQQHFDQNGRERVCHIRSSASLSSPRRLREQPYRLSLIAVFLRRALAFAGIGRRRGY